MPTMQFKRVGRLDWLAADGEGKFIPSERKTSKQQEYRTIVKARQHASIRPTQWIIRIRNSCMQYTNGMDGSDAFICPGETTNWPRKLPCLDDGESRMHVRQQARRRRCEPHDDSVSNKDAPTKEADVVTRESEAPEPRREARTWRPSVRISGPEWA
jgi:hypothetical protein